MSARDVLRKIYNPQCYGEPCPACDEATDRIIRQLADAGLEIRPSGGALIFDGPHTFRHKPPCPVLTAAGDPQCTCPPIKFSGRVSI